MKPRMVKLHLPVGFIKDGYVGLAMLVDSIPAGQVPTEKKMRYYWHLPGPVPQILLKPKDRLRWIFELPDGRNLIIQHNDRTKDMIQRIKELDYEI